MLYASGKQPLVDFLEGEEIGLVIDKKAEIEDVRQLFRCFGPCARIFKLYTRRGMCSTWLPCFIAC